MRGVFVERMWATIDDHIDMFIESIEDMLSKGIDPVTLLAGLHDSPPKLVASKRTQSLSEPGVPLSPLLSLLLPFNSHTLLQ